MFSCFSQLNFSLLPDLEESSLNLGKARKYGFLGVILVASILVTIALASYGLPGEAYRRALFQVVSVITTTGFSSDNYDQWPDLARAILLVLMFFGGCTGSTTGAIKIGRLVVLFRYSCRQIIKAFNPRQVIPTKLDGVALPATAIHSMAAFFFIYLTLFAFGLYGLPLPGPVTRPSVPPQPHQQYPGRGWGR